jgi:tetratricopeptide (TPR) repeat protein
MRFYFSLGVVAFSRIAFLATLNPLIGSIAQDLVEDFIDVIDATNIATLIDQTEVIEQELVESEIEVIDADAPSETFVLDFTEIAAEVTDVTDFAPPTEATEAAAEAEVESAAAAAAAAEEKAAQDQLLLNELNAMLDKGKNADAVLRTIDELSPEVRSTLPYQTCLARAYVQVGRADEAEEILLSLTNGYPADLESHRLLGSYYVQKQRYNEAEAYLSRAVNLDPLNWKAMAGLGKVFLLRDDDKIRARQYLSEAVSLEPNDENLRFELAMILFHFDDHSEAKDALDAAETLNPNIDHKVCYYVIVAILGCFR